MKIRILVSLLVVFSTFTATNAQGKKEKKPKRKEQPKLTVVEIAKAPPISTPVENAKPTNGSLFTDNSVNGNLLRDFKARQIGRASCRERV